MNISNTSSMVSINNTSQSNSRQNTSLNSSQKEFVSSLLSNYDSQNLSTEDATSIVESLKDEGIKASSSLAQTMEESGFNAQEIGELANVENSEIGTSAPPPHPPRPSSGEEDEEDESIISELLDSLLSTDEDDETSTTISTSFEDIMEYTSRIVSLNEDSQSDVMDLLDKYNNEESDFSKEEIGTIVKYSLGEILSEPSNYNRISFYA